MFDRYDVVEYYNKDPNVQRLRGLENRIRALHQSTDYKAALDMIRDSNDESLESTLRENIASTIRREALNPPIQQRYYAEWDEKLKVIRLMLPFPFEGLFDDFSLVGLSRWYANANRNITPILSEPGYGGYAVFEINGVPNLSVADRTLNGMVNPPEFEYLSLQLSPILMLLYQSKIQKEPQNIVLPKGMHPIMKGRYEAILKIVGDHFDDTGNGISPTNVWKIMAPNDRKLAPSKVKWYMPRMFNEGLLQKDVAKRKRAKYFPLNAVVNNT